MNLKECALFFLCAMQSNLFCMMDSVPYIGFVTVGGLLGGYAGSKFVNRSTTTITDSDFNNLVNLYKAWPSFSRHIINNIFYYNDGLICSSRDCPEPQRDIDATGQEVTYKDQYWTNEQEIFALCLVDMRFAKKENELFKKDKFWTKKLFEETVKSTCTTPFDVNTELDEFYHYIKSVGHFEKEKTPWKCRHWLLGRCPEYRISEFADFNAGSDVLYEQVPEIIAKDKAALQDNIEKIMRNKQEEYTNCFDLSKYQTNYPKETLLFDRGIMQLAQDHILKIIDEKEKVTARGTNRGKNIWQEVDRTDDSLHIFKTYASYEYFNFHLSDSTQKRLKTELTTALKDKKMNSAQARVVRRNVVKKFITEYMQYYDATENEIEQELNNFSEIKFKKRSLPTLYNIAKNPIVIDAIAGAGVSGLCAYWLKCKN